MAVADSVSPNAKDHRLLAVWAADCAERALSLFEDANPDDDRPRRAIEAARAWVRGDLKMTGVRDAALAAHAAARNSDNESARLAARATGHAAATAHVADHAPHAANYAIKAMSIAATNEDRDTVIAAEHEWQYKQLAEHLRELLRKQ
ncbi:MAG: hypothetical protein KAU31_06545 [Spirochaetaceae bacterium]|nr:hypothetical protein [Spirochaetaceae bacterium]